MPLACVSSAGVDTRDGGKRRNTGLIGVGVISEIATGAETGMSI